MPRLSTLLPDSAVNYTPSDADTLAGHLGGIDTALGTVSGGSSERAMLVKNDSQTLTSNVSNIIQFVTHESTFGTLDVSTIDGSITADSDGWHLIRAAVNLTGWASGDSATIGILINNLVSWEYAYTIGASVDQTLAIEKHLNLINGDVVKIAVSPTTSETITTSVPTVAAPSIVQIASSTSNVTSIALSSAPTEGNAQFLFLWGSAAITTSLSGWTTLQSAYFSSSIPTGYSSVFGRIVPSGASSTVSGFSAPAAGGSQRAIILIEVGNGDFSDGFIDGSVVNGGPSAIPSLTTTKQPCLQILGSFIQNSETVAISGFTNRADLGLVALLDRQLFSVGAQTTPSSSYAMHSNGFLTFAIPTVNNPGPHVRSSFFSVEKV